MALLPVTLLALGACRSALPPAQTEASPQPDAATTSDTPPENEAAAWEPAPGCGNFPPELEDHPANRIELGQQNISNVIIDIGLPNERGEMDNDQRTPFAHWVIVDEVGTSFFSVTEGTDGWIYSVYLDYPLADDGVTELENSCSWGKELDQ